MAQPSSLKYRAMDRHWLITIEVIMRLFLFLVLGADRALVAFRESSDELATALVKNAGPRTSMCLLSWPARSPR